MQLQGMTLQSGMGVGASVGAVDGVALGASVGAEDGTAVGAEVGDDVGEAVVGSCVGALVGATVGMSVGVPEGALVGVAVGEIVGVVVGDFVGAAVGKAVGAVGDCVGDRVGICRKKVVSAVLLGHSDRPVVESYTYTNTRGSVTCHISSHAIELSDWLTKTVTVITRSVSNNATSTLSEMERTLVPLAFLALRTRRSTPLASGRLVCTRTCTGSGSRHASMAGLDTTSTLSTVVGAVVGAAEGVPVVGASVGDLVGMSRFLVMSDVLLDQPAGVAPLSYT